MGTPKNGVKSRKLYGHLAWTTHKVCKIAEKSKMWEHKTRVLLYISCHL